MVWRPLTVLMKYQSSLITAPGRSARVGLDLQAQQRVAGHRALQGVFQRLQRRTQVAVQIQAGEQRFIAAQIVAAQIAQLPLLLVEQPEAVQRQLQLGQIIDQRQQIA